MNSIYRTPASTDTEIQRHWLIELSSTNSICMVFQFSIISTVVLKCWLYDHYYSLIIVSLRDSFLVEERIYIIQSLASQSSPSMNNYENINLYPIFFLTVKTFCLNLYICTLYSVVG